MNDNQNPAAEVKPAIVAGRWSDGELPANVRLGTNTLLTANYAFKRFFSRESNALVIGSHCTMDGVHFAVGEKARLRIGDYCYFTNALLLCELEIAVGDYVVIGLNATIADTDFHPVAPAVRVADAIACSPLGKGRTRPEIIRRAVVIASKQKMPTPTTTKAAAAKPPNNQD